MIHDPILRGLVIVLFVLSAAECGWAIITGRPPWTVVVSHGLHLVMAVAMVAMALPWGAELPTTGPALFFVLAAGWFVTLAVVAGRTAPQRMVYGYHVLMMAATAWMYALMDGQLLSGRSPERQPTEAGASMPDMDMASMNMPASSGSPSWLSAVSWVGVVSFTVAVVYWACRYVMALRHASTRLRSLGALGQTMMATGMAILFLATLFQI